MIRKVKMVVGLCLFAGMLTMKGQVPDLCKRVDMKPVLSLEQVRMAEFVEFICEIAGIKQLPGWPSEEEIAQMTPEQYYQMEVKMLIDNGFPPIFAEIEPERLVNRRFFASVMFQIAMQVDEKVKRDCANATTETEQLDCLVQHDWLYSKAGKIYREEILAILCSKREALKPPAPMFMPMIIFPEEFKGGIIEIPATPTEED